MDVASETEALLAGIAKEATSAAEAVDDAPAQQQVLANGEKAPEAFAANEAVEPAVIQVEEQVDDGEQVTTVQATYVTGADSAAPDVVTATEDPATVVDQVDQPALASTEETAEPQLNPVPDQPAELPAANGISNAEVNGVPDTNGTLPASTTADTAQAEPERGRSRKRRARWGPPANAPAEPTADPAADGEQTGRKKRRSRWEEPAPAAEDSQQLTVIDTAGGAGFPHEIVLAGGIKVRHEFDMHHSFNVSASLHSVIKVHDKAATCCCCS